MTLIDIFVVGWDGKEKKEVRGKEERRDDRLLVSKLL